MQEIVIKNNTLGMKVFMDNLFDITQMPAKELDLLISDLELEVYQKVEMKKKKYKERKSLKTLDKKD